MPTISARSIDVDQRSAAARVKIAEAIRDAGLTPNADHAPARDDGRRLHEAARGARAGRAGALGAMRTAPVSDRAATGCDMDSLHTRAAELAIALAAMIEDHTDGAQATAALGALSAELAKVIGDRPRVS